MISKDLLLVPGEDKIFLVNVNHYKIVREIDVQGSGFISSGCLLNANMLITGDYSKTLRQWKIEVDNLISANIFLLSSDNNSAIVLILAVFLIPLYLLIRVSKSIKIKFSIIFTIKINTTKISAKNTSNP